MTTKTLNYNNEILIVSGTYTESEKGDGYMTPDWSSTFESDSIMYKGVDIRPVITDEMTMDIEEKCLILIEN